MHAIVYPLDSHLALPLWVNPLLMNTNGPAPRPNVHFCLSVEKRPGHLSGRLRSPHELHESTGRGRYIVA